MKYPYFVRLIQETDGEQYWVAKSESLKGCIGAGDTPEEAVKELEENEIAWIETALEFGTEIPPVPFDREEEYSGKFTVRVSPFEHRRAAEQAKKQGISLNQYVSDAIVNYNAEERTAGYISESVAAIAQDIGRRSLDGTTYTITAIVPTQLTNERTKIRLNPYKQ